MIFKKLPFWRNYTTEHHRNWWTKRQIDWNQAYLSTWNHPHRYVISAVLKNLNWFSLIEIGCGAGANLVNIVNNFKDRQLGGVDVNEEAIKVASKALTGAHLQVGRGDDVMMSDDSTDVILSDMYLIYVGPRKIKKHLKEMKRLARKYVVLCEFSSNSWFKRMYVRMKSGYHAHDYQKLLTDMGFYGIQRYKLIPEMWPGGGWQEKVGYIYIAKVPRRK